MAGGWASLGLLDELVEAVEEEFGWILPTAIQDEAIPLILGGSDVMASAETGSGKTAAFALPILQLCVELKEQQQRESSKDQQHVKRTTSKEETSAWRLSLLDRNDSIAFHPSNPHQIQSRHLQNWAGCRATLGVNLLKQQQVSFVVHPNDDGLVRVGWTTEDGSLQIGIDKEGWGYGSTGVRVHKKDYQPYGRDGEGDDDDDMREAFGKDDEIACHLRVVSEKNGNDKSAIVAVASFSKNGRFLGDAFEIRRNDLDGAEALYPTVCLKNAECTVQFQGKASLPDHYKLVGDGSLRMNNFVANPRDSASVDKSKQRGPFAIVIEPTRDLAEQTYRVFDDLASRIKEPGIQAALLVGGVNSGETARKLEQNKVDILVGTPPITASYMKKGTIQPHRCRFFVLDEADELITSDSIKNIQAIYGRLLAVTENRSRFDRLQVCFFSATLDSKEVRRLANSICHRPLWIKLRGEKDSVLPDTVQHCFVEIDPASFPKDCLLLKTDAVHRKGKPDAAVQLDKLSAEEANSEKIKQLKMKAVLDVMEKFDMDQVLIFCRTNLDCDLMEKYLNEKGGGSGIVNKYSCRVLAGMRAMKERQKNLEDFKNAEVRILICTDVAARGIDIRELPFVINYTLPDSADTYVHRVGRVGRAERMGLAVSLVGREKERVWFCQPGKKPPQQDVRDFDKGGNCIWYDEPGLFKDIEKLLAKNNAHASKVSYPLLELPADISRIVAARGYGNFAAEEKVDPEMQATLSSLKERVRDIDLMESALQTGYFDIKHVVSKASKALHNKANS